MFFSLLKILKKNSKEKTFENQKNKLIKYKLYFK